MNEGKARRVYLKWRSGFVLKLTLFHFALILLFDVLAIYSPGIMTTSIWKDSVFSIGVVYAFSIVLSVICFTFYYSYRINQEESAFTDNLDQRGEDSH